MQFIFLCISHGIAKILKIQNEIRDTSGNCWPNEIAGSQLSIANSRAVFKECTATQILLWEVWKIYGSVERELYIDIHICIYLCRMMVKSFSIYLFFVALDECIRVVGGQSN